MSVNAQLLSYIKFFGNPVIAVGIGLIIAIYTLTNNMKRLDTLDRMEEGIKSSGIILLVTGAGGALETSFVQVDLEIISLSKSLNWLCLPSSCRS